MSDKEVYERLTRLETIIQDHAQRDAERSARIDEIDAKQDAIIQELARYRGTVGGVLLVVTALVTAFKLFGGYILGRFSL